MTLLNWRSLLVGALASAAIACGVSTDRSEGWDLTDSIDEELRMHRGIYATELEILEDTCEPAMTRLVGGDENWPPPRVMIVHEREAARYGLLQVPVFALRDAHYFLSYTRTTADFDINSSLLWEEEWPSLMHFADVGCPDGSFAPSSNTRATILAERSDELTVRVRSTWGRLDECVSERARALFASIPHEQCTEEYVMHYKLIEQCPDSCALLPNQLRGTVVEGYPQLNYDGEVSCSCPDQNETQRSNTIPHTNETE